MTMMLTLAIRTRRVSGDKEETGEQPRPRQPTRTSQRSQRRRMRTDEDYEDGEQPRG
ncbi:L-2-aminoadipate reductase large subunit [Venturia inaequalis]|nr:L-2-aminoadipate reductase large subunit [Venturia inaequalis]